ncbi:MAG TPA: DUF4115 domain-containing protein, partial [Gaiellaceae bacterium]|nr:DUF4115 domain-containing protein [Gaiellaceae bacterium]
PPAPRPASAASRPEAAAVRIALVAARGDCWLLVRAGSARGRVLYEGTLRHGDTIRFRRERLWLRLGAPWNVDVRLDGRPYAGLAPMREPVNVVVTRAGIRTV